MRIQRPERGEYPPYYQTYIDQVPEGDILRILNLQKIAFSEFLYSIPDHKWELRYAPGKFSVAEVLSHIIDTERIFSYRALRFARNDRTELPGYDQDSYGLGSGAGHRSKSSIETEYLTVRNATIELFRTFDQTALRRSGIASGAELFVGAIPYILVGHELHHIRILQERYLQGETASHSDLPWRFSMVRAFKALEQAQNPMPFVTLMNEQAFTVEWYAPKDVDTQTPHLEDELYIIASGSGIFINGGQSVPFAAGDVLFVPAGQEHRFVDFSDDFATWVVFFK